MIFTEKQLVAFCNYLLKDKQVSDADLRNYFGANYDSIKEERKQKLKKIYSKK
jgi:hypothetical protein